MTALWYDMGFLTWETETEAEGFKADGTLFLVVCRVVAGDDGERSGDHGSVRMDGGRGAVGLVRVCVVLLLLLLVTVLLLLLVLLLVLV